MSLKIWQTILLLVFYRQELQIVMPNGDEIYEIKRIIKKRKRSGKVKALVKWVGCNKKVTGTDNFTNQQRQLNNIDSKPTPHPLKGEKYRKKKK